MHCTTVLLKLQHNSQFSSYQSIYVQFILIMDSHRFSTQKQLSIYFCKLVTLYLNRREKLRNRTNHDIVVFLYHIGICILLSIYIYTYLANANSMLNNTSKLQFQQILKHPQIMSVGIPNLSKTYTYKIIYKNRHTRFYVV